MKRFSVCYMLKPDNTITCMFSDTSDKAEWFGGEAPVKSGGLREYWFNNLFEYCERECARHGGQMDRLYYGGKKTWSW